MTHTITDEIAKELKDEEMRYEAEIEAEQYNRELDEYNETKPF